MGDPKDWQAAQSQLRDLVGTDPALRMRVGDEAADVSWAALEQLLASRLERAAAEALETWGRAGSAGVDMSDVAREIVQGDLAVNPASTVGGRMISESDEIVLRHVPLSNQLVTSRVRRCYLIEDAAGRELGLVHQVRAHDFDVLDRTIGQTYVFRQAGDQLYIRDEIDAQLGFVSFKEREPGSSFKILSSIDRGMLHVRPRSGHPYHLEVVGNIGGEIGAIERRFVGLAPFADEANRIRIRVQPGRVSPGQRLGLMAVALLAGNDD